MEEKIKEMKRQQEAQAAENAKLEQEKHMKEEEAKRNAREIMESIKNQNPQKAEQILVKR